MANHLSYDVLSRLLERRVAPDEEAKAERHLARCGRCRDERQWLERIRTYPQARTLAQGGPAASPALNECA